MTDNDGVDDAAPSVWRCLFLLQSQKTLAIDDHHQPLTHFDDTVNRYLINLGRLIAKMQFHFHAFPVHPV